MLGQSHATSKWLGCDMNLWGNVAPVQAPHIVPCWAQSMRAIRSRGKGPSIPQGRNQFCLGRWAAVVCPV